MTQSLRWLQSEIADRMLQKLDIVKLDPKDILLIPDFPGAHAEFLRKRFPKVAFHSVAEEGLSAIDYWRLKIARQWRNLFRGGSSAFLEVFRRTGRIELPDNSVDLIFSDLLVQDLPDPKHFLQECWRVLREGGLLTLSYLGPDTGKELCAIESPSQLGVRPLLSSWDMHDMGDALLGERFSDPVMDMEFLTLDYESDALMLSDAQALGLIRPLQSSQESLELPKKLTLELVYGHAWALILILNKSNARQSLILIECEYLLSFKPRLGLS
jgi:malonyl-CoA O-methyltransferase